MLKNSVFALALIFTGCAKPNQFNTYTALGDATEAENCRWIVRHSYGEGLQNSDVLLYCCGGIVSDAYAAQPTWNKAPSCIKAENGIVVTPPTPVVAPVGPKANFP